MIYKSTAVNSWVSLWSTTQALRLGIPTSYETRVNEIVIFKPYQLLLSSDALMWLSLCLCVCLLTD